MSGPGRVALVTGAASGIGAATARHLAGGGARLVLVDRDAVALEELAGAIDAVAFAGDVTDPDVDAEAVRTAVRSYGRLDLLVANAGRMTTSGLEPVDIATMNLEAYEATRAVNVDAVVHGIQAAVSALRRDGGGSVVVTASLAGLVPYPPDPIYTLTKHAVVGLVRALAEPLARDGVAVSAVCPGFVDTPLLAGATERVRAAFPLLEADNVARGVEHAWDHAEPGACWVLQAGREPVAHRAAGVPGPHQPSLGRS